jgi:hypothetical protein
MVHRSAKLGGLAALLLSACAGHSPVWGITLNGTGQVTLAGADAGLYLGAGAFYSAGYTGTRANMVNIEGGQPWLGHQSLTSVRYMPLLGGSVASIQDHATAVTSIMGGRGNRSLDTGIAFGAVTFAGTLATAMNGASFTFSPASFGQTYLAGATGFVPQGGTALVRADVINSSWGLRGGTWTGASSYTDQLDAIVARTGVTVVTAAGNSGPIVNTLGVPNAAFNAFTVAALKSDTPPEVNPAFNSVSSFSSRSPTFVLLPGQGQLTRAAVHIAAPGEDFSAAAYDVGAPPNWYRFNREGTSFAAPLVAAGAALLADVAYDRYVTPGNRSSVDFRTLKAVLMNSADKTVGWNNGQALLAGVTRTTQALDLNVGTGRMNLSRAFRQFTMGTTGDATPTAGTPALVATTGWDVDTISSTNSTLAYTLNSLLPGNGLTTLTATLVWGIDATYFDSTDNAALDALADLALEVHRLTPTGSQLVAVSDGTHNTAEHLSFVLPAAGQYELRVRYVESDYNVSGNTNTRFALAWDAVAIPEPSYGGAGLAVGVFVGMRGRRRRGRT